jgi:hypothetical protein
MTAKTSQAAAQTAPRPDLGAHYKPVGISAVTAATLCRKAPATASAATGTNRRS